MILRRQKRHSRRMLASPSSLSVAPLQWKWSQRLTLLLLLCCYCSLGVQGFVASPCLKRVAQVQSSKSLSVSSARKCRRSVSSSSLLSAALDDTLITDLDLSAVLQQVAGYTVTRRGRQALLDLAETKHDGKSKQQQSQTPWSSSSSSSSSASSRQRRVLQQASSTASLSLFQQRNRLELHVAGDVDQARRLYEPVEQAMLVIEHAAAAKTTVSDGNKKDVDDDSLDSMTLPPLYGIYENDDSDETSASWPWQVSSSSSSSRSTAITIDTDDDEFLDTTVTAETDWTLQDVIKAEQVARRILAVRKWAQSAPIVTWAPSLSDIILAGTLENEDVSSALQSLLDDIGHAVEIVRVKTAMDPTGKTSYSFQLSGRKYHVLAMLRQQVQEGQSPNNNSKKTNPKLSDLQQALEETEHEITLGLFASVARQAAVLDAGLQAVAQLDVVLAKGAFGVVYGGALPRVVEQSIINVSGFVHPLLLSESPSATSAVPVDLHLGLGQADGNSQYDESSTRPDETEVTESHALIISGPNGGGKTLAMKSFGLVSVLVKLGIPLPVRGGQSHDGSRQQTTAIAGYFDQIHTALGDRQSVITGQSTFIAQLSTYAGILERVGSGLSGTNITATEVPDGDPQRVDYTATKENILVLLDELGSGTEAEGGGAIGQAVLEHMLHEENSGTTCRVVATTHSRRLKALSMEDERFSCATVLLQNQAGVQRPSYRLQYGLIGESFALEAASRATPSLPEAVIQRATELVQSTVRKRQTDDGSESRIVVEEDEAYIRALRKSMEQQTALTKAANVEARQYVAGMQNVQKSLVKLAQQYERKWNGWQVRLEEAYRRLKQDAEDQNDNTQSASLKVVGDTLDELRLMREALPHDKERLAQQGLRLVPDDYALHPDDLVVIVDGNGEWDGLEGRILQKDDSNSHNYLVSISPDPWSEPTIISFSRFQLAIWDYSSMWEEENDNWTASSPLRRQRVDTLLSKIDMAASSTSNTSPIKKAPRNNTMSGLSSGSPQSSTASGTTPQRHTSARARKAANGNKKRKKK